MQSDFNSRYGMRGMNRDGISRGGIPFGANRFMGRMPPIPPLKPPGMRNREAGGPRDWAGGPRGDFPGGSFGGIGEGRYFGDFRDRWEPPGSLSMRNTGLHLDESNVFPLNNFGPGPDHGRFGQNSSSSDNPPVARRRRSKRLSKSDILEYRKAKRLFQIPPGRFQPPGPFPPGPFPPIGNMPMPGWGMRPQFPGFARNRGNATEKNPQTQNEPSPKKESPPWYDEDVFKLLKVKGKAHKRMKRSSTEANVQAFKDLRKEVRKLTRQKYSDYCIKLGIPNKYTEAAKAKKQKYEEALAAKAALENNNKASTEIKEKSADAAEVVDNENNTAEVVEENNVDSAQLANESSPVVENNNSPPVENPCDNTSLMEDSTCETTES